MWQIFEILYDKKNEVVIKNKKMETVLTCPCLKKNKYLSYWVKNHDKKSISLLKINDDFCFVNCLDRKEFKLNEIKSFKLENVALVW